jgi:hypothetical protein
VFEFEIEDRMNNCIVFVYRGSGTINNNKVNQFDVLHFDASDSNSRLLRFESGSSSKLNAMIFAGKKLNQPIGN